MALVVLLVLVLLFIVLLGRGVSAAGTLVLTIAAGAVVTVATFMDPDAGFLILIASMLWSPELRVGGVPQRIVVVRVDDILLFIVFVVWWGRLALRRELSILRRTPLNGPILLFIAACVWSTLLGVVGGTVLSPKTSVFYLLKYTEYFMVYFMFTNQVRTDTQLRRFLGAVLLTFLTIAIYGYTPMAHAAGRVSAPFEGSHAEPNTMAGYMVLLLSVITGLALYAPAGPRRWALCGVAALGIPPFLNTLSRGGYLAIMAAYSVLVCLAKPSQRLWLIALAVVTLLVFPSVAPPRVLDRVVSTFRSGGRVQVSKRHYLDPSAEARVVIWPWILEQVKKRPLFGYGVTGVGLVDEQYALILGELGCIGLAIYLWTRWLIWANGLRVLQMVKDPLQQGLTRGFLAGFIALMVHSVAGNIFIIVRIMEPFWCLAAMVMVLPELSSPSPGVTRTQFHVA